MTYKLRNIITDQFIDSDMVVTEREAARLNKIRLIEEKMGTRKDKCRWMEYDGGLIGVTNNIPEILARFSMFGGILVMLNVLIS